MGGHRLRRRCARNGHAANHFPRLFLCPLTSRPCGTRRFPAGSHAPATDVCIACRLLLSSYRTSCDIILARLKLLMLFGHIYGVAGGTSWTFKNIFSALFLVYINSGIARSTKLVGWY